MSWLPSSRYLLDPENIPELDAVLTMATRARWVCPRWWWWW
jgi:hypothetical protein